MRNLTELIVLVRGGGEVGSAIAHRLFRSHFRVCISEAANPSPICRTMCFSEAIFDTTQTVEGVTAEKCAAKLEQVYKIWRADRIPVVQDPDLTVKALVRPDVLVNAMMLKHTASTKPEDAPLVVGIGEGFTAGENAHIVIGSEGRDLGKVILEGAEQRGGAAEEDESPGNLVVAEDAGVFSAVKSICDAVSDGEVIGYLGDTPVTSPARGVLRGLVRNDTKVLAGTPLAQVETSGDKESCFTIAPNVRAIAGGVLEAILFVHNSSHAD